MRIIHPAFGRNILSKSINYIWSNVSSKASVFLLTFCQDDLSINASRVVESPAIIIELLAISPFSCVNNCFVYFSDSMLYTYSNNCYVFLMDFLLYHYLMWIFVFIYLFWLEVYFIWYNYGDMYPVLADIFLEYYLLLFLSLWLSLELRLISWKQHMVVLFFNVSNHSVSFDWWIQSIYI